MNHVLLQPALSTRFSGRTTFPQHSAGTITVGQNPAIYLTDGSQDFGNPPLKKPVTHASTLSKIHHHVAFAEYFKPLLTPKNCDRLDKALDQIDDQATQAILNPKRFKTQQALDRFQVRQDCQIVKALRSSGVPKTLQHLFIQFSSGAFHS